MKKRNIIILIVVLILAVGGYIAYSKFEEKTADLEDKKPDVVITATELIAAFDRDTASARKMYVDKIIEVSGAVVSVDSSGSVVLGGSGDLSSVTVSLDRRHLSDHQKLKPGSAAVLKGICSGYSKSASDPDDLLAGLGTTVELNFALVKDKK